MKGSIQYAKSYLESRSVPVLVVGDSSWIENVSKGLGKKWKQIQWVPTEESFKEQLSLSLPKICFIELGALGHKELRIVETFLPDSVRVIVIGPEGSEGELWQRLEKRLCPYRVPALILPKNPAMAADELSEILENSISLGIYSDEEEFATIRAGYAGYLSGSRDRPSIVRNREFFKAIHSYLMSQYSFTVIEIDAAILLAETYDYWKAPKPQHDPVHHAFVLLENRLADTAALGLLELAVDVTAIFSDNGPLGSVEWESLLKRNALFETSKKLHTIFGDVSALIAEYRRRSFKAS